MTPSYWKKYWDEHVNSCPENNPFSRVLRTLHGEPQDNDIFNANIDYIAKVLSISPEDSILDVCCGNGLITNAISPLCKEIVGIDFCSELINEAKKKNQVILHIFLPMLCLLA